MPHVSWIWIVLLAVVAFGVAFGPRLWRLYVPRFGAFAGKAYTDRILKQLKAKYPTVAERMEGFDLGPDSQGSFTAALKRLPPQRAMELQMEFNRLRENFMTRHPELEPVLGAG